MRFPVGRDGRVPRNERKRRSEERVPKPANSNVAETESPVSVGTKMVAPNMANMCWMPKTVIFGAPNVRAS